LFRSGIEAWQRHARQRGARLNAPELVLPRQADSCAACEHTEYGELRAQSREARAARRCGSDPRQHAAPPRCQSGIRHVARVTRKNL